MITVLKSTSPVGKYYDVDGKHSHAQPSKMIARTTDKPLGEVLEFVGNDPHAMLILNGFSGIPAGEDFIIKSEAALRDAGQALREGEYSRENGRIVTGRFLERMAPPTVLMLDRDVDDQTPEQFKNLSWDAWLELIDKHLLPGLLKTTRHYTLSSSARIFDLNECATLADSNGHCFLEVTKPIGNIETFKRMLEQRAYNAGLLWEWRNARGACSFRTIIDLSVFTPGRLVFDGAPQSHADHLLVEPAKVTTVKGEADKLDLGEIVLPPQREYSAAIREVTGATASFNPDGTQVAYDVHRGMVFDTKDYGLVEGADALHALVKQHGIVRMQSPFRPSVSWAVNALLSNGQLCLMDHGTGARHFPPIQAVDADFEGLEGELAPVRKASKHPSRNQVIRALCNQLAACFGSYAGYSADSMLPLLKLDMVDEVLETTSFDGEKYTQIHPHDGTMLQHQKEVHFMQSLAQRYQMRLGCSQPWDSAAIKAIIQDVEDEDGDNKVLKDFGKLSGWSTVLTGVRDNCYDLIMLREDPFATEAYQQVREGVLRVIMPMQPFTRFGASAEQRRAVRAVWDKHFTMFWPFVEMMLAARVATDRKKASVWLHAESDFGKSAFVEPLKRLEIVAPLSMKQLKAIGNQQPTGLTPQYFRKAWLLHIDEGDTMPGEFLELNSQITVNQKGAGVFTAEVFAKLIACAADNKQLTGAGVDAQYANRISYERGLGKATDAFAALNKVYKQDQVYEAIADEVADYLENRIAELRLMGREAARGWASDYIDEYHAKRKLTKVFGGGDDHLTGLFMDMVEGLRTSQDPDAEVTTPLSKRFLDEARSKVTVNDDKVYLRAPESVFKLYLKFDAMVEDPQGVSAASKRVAGALRKLVKPVREDAGGQAAPVRIGGVLGRFYEVIP